MLTEKYNSIFRGGKNEMSRLQVAKHKKMAEFTIVNKSISAMIVADNSL